MQKHRLFIYLLFLFSFIKLKGYSIQENECPSAPPAKVLTDSVSQTKRNTSEGIISQLHHIRQPFRQQDNSFEHIQRQLTDGIIIGGIPLKEYDLSIGVPGRNEMVLIETSEQKILKAIFKPRGSLHRKAEQAAFKISNYLGFNLVPPTVEKSFNGNEGVVSYYIDTDNKSQQDPWEMRKNNTVDSIQQFIDPESLNHFYAFCIIFGMWDLKWVNTILVGEKPPYHILSLDNESLVSSVYLPRKEHFFVCWKIDPLCNQKSTYKDLENFSSKTLKITKIPEMYEQLKRFLINDASIQQLKTEEEKQEKILQRIKSFFWGKSQLNYYIGEKALWLQLYKYVENAPAPEVHFLNPFVISQLEKMDITLLKTFFDDQNPEKQVFSDDHYCAILKRCNNLLAALREKQNLPREFSSSAPSSLLLG